MKNAEVAALLYEMADLLELQGVEFKPRAYRKAAQTIESLAEDVASIYQHQGIKGLMEIPGVGKGIAEKIVQYLSSGRILQIEELKKKLPIAPELLELTGLGPKTVMRLYKELKIGTVEDLARAAKAGKIAQLRGMQAKSKQILEALARKGKSRRMLLGDALLIARNIASFLRGHCDAIDIAGSLRRRQETIGDIDLIVGISDSDKVRKVVLRYPDISKVLGQGPTKISVLLQNNVQVDVRMVHPSAYGAALLYFTGSKSFNIRLRTMALAKKWKLSEYGLFAGKKIIAGKTEQEIFKKFKMQYIEPEMREDAGETEAALHHRLPQLVTQQDIEGDLQLQTTWSDGVSTIEQYVQQAEKLDYSYIAITDHTKTLAIAHGLTPRQQEQQAREIARVQKKFDIQILRGAEVNILADGSLDMPHAALKKLDIILASIHSGFSQNKQQIMRRLTVAMDSAHIIAHPSGRKIYQRPGYELDYEMLFDRAKQTGTALEINSYADRMDLNDTAAREAGKKGCLFVIDTDAHHVDHMRFMELGVSIARRAWLEPKSIINTWPLQKLKRWLEKK